MTDSIANTCELRAETFNELNLQPVNSEKGNRRNYRQIYRSEWETNPLFKGWLSPLLSDKYKAVCIACKKELLAHRLTLLKHASSAKHLSKLELLNETNALLKSQSNEDLGESTFKMDYRTSHDCNSESLSEVVKLENVSTMRFSIQDAKNDELLNCADKEFSSEMIISSAETSEVTIEKTGANVQPALIHDESFSCSNVTAETETEAISIFIETEAFVDVSNSSEAINFKPGYVVKNSDTNVKTNDGILSCATAFLTDKMDDGIEDSVLNKITTYPLQVSTRVTDYSRGVSVSNMNISLYKLSGGKWMSVAESVTDEIGRCNLFPKTESHFSTGCYKLHYDVATYYEWAPLFVIAIASNAKINCVEWNSNSDWIAVGGEDALLKIFKLETVNKEKNKSGNGASNPFPNHNLRVHSGQVHIVVWNEQYNKLTSSDDAGSVIVWILHNGTWYEEMINNRNKSVVRGVAWSNDGLKICIIYEDGVVIVGSMDGARIWGKELKKVGLSCVQWSPDSKYILFGIRNGELHLYDDEGVFSMKVKVQCLPSVQVIVQIAGLHWYNGVNGFHAENCPILAVVYQSGHVQLMRNQHDEHPIILDTGMYAAQCRWNHDGSTLAIVGSTVLIGENKETNVVQFFSAFGEHIRTLKLPGSGVSDCSWEGRSLKIVLAVDSNLLFADIRPNYKWCYFSQTLVYSGRSRNKVETVITFWDTKNNESHQKTVKSLLSIAAHRDHCVLASETENAIAQYSLMVCNTLTTVIDCKYMDLKPMWVSINSTHVFAASQENFIMWNYMTPKSRSSMFKISGNRHKKERLYHVDDTPSGVAEVIQDLDKNYEESIKYQATKDPICCMACSDKTLLIGRRSGTIQRYTLPQVALVQRLVLLSKPQCIAINCNSSKISVIDCTGALSLITLQKDVKENYGIVKEEGRQVERRDVWDMKWATDNPSYLAVMEKTRMYVLKDGMPEEPINSVAYIADFENLEIKGVLLDEIISSSNELNHECILNFEVKSLRDTRELLQKVGVPEATAFIEKNPHPRLWRLLAEAAVQNLDLSTAEMAYVRRSDYSGIQLIKKLSAMQDSQMKAALVASYFQKFDEAETLYLKSDRRDMAIALREKLGDWFRVVELMKTGSITSDSQLTKAWNNIGDYFIDRGKWEPAKEYYQKANNYEKLITCYQYLEDYDALASCISLLPEKHPLLDKIGETFLNVGMCSLSVDAYLKFGAIQSAVESCMKLNHWDKALQLSNKYSLNVHVSQLFDKHVNQLLQRGRKLDTVQLYRKADRFLEAAELLFELANEQTLERKSPLLLKKIYVLVGFLVEDHISFTKTSRSKAAGTRSIPAVGVGVDSFRSLKLLDNPWHNAEAYHFLMLSQRQLMNGKPELALRTAVKLRAYNDVLSPQQTCSILAVCAIANRAFEIASKAFTELEVLETDCKKDYENIALHLFSKNEPNDPPEKRYKCSNCSSSQSLWNLVCEHCGTQGVSCMATGQVIQSMTDAWQCNICKHFTLYTEMSRHMCPLCRFPTKL